MHLAIKSEDEQIVYGEVYAPNRPDAQGEFMTKDEVRKMAHNFIRSGKMKFVDVMHNNEIANCCVVESCVALDSDTEFIPGSWVIGMKIDDADVWAAIKNGEINGFSMEALVTRHEREVEIEIPAVVTGLTSKNDDGHQHKFYLSYDEEGVLKGGVTDTVNGHSHSITHGTHTAKVNGHSHRFSSVDDVQILES